MESGCSIVWCMVQNARAGIGELLLCSFTEAFICTIAIKQRSGLQTVSSCCCVADAWVHLHSCFSSTTGSAPKICHSLGYAMKLVNDVSVIDKGG